MNLVVLNKKYVFFKHYRGSHSFDSVYKYDKMNIFAKAFRLFWNVLGFEMNGLFFGNWYKSLKNGEKTIFFDEISFRKRIIKVINKNAANCKVYLWNPVKSIRTRKQLDKIRCEICTFSKEDSIQYGYRYVGTFLIPVQTSSNFKITTDFLFVGKDKGRKERVYSFVNKMSDCGFSFDINVVENSRDYIGYSDYLQKLHSSKCILEFIQNRENCETLRMVEHLFYGKKIITENSLARELPYYSKSNILILDSATSKEDVKHFMSLPFDEAVAQQYASHYTIDSLIERIFKDE